MRALYPRAKLLGAVGYPPRVSRKGKAPPWERGRGRHYVYLANEVGGKMFAQAFCNNQHISGVLNHYILNIPFFFVLVW